MNLKRKDEARAQAEDYNKMCPEEVSAKSDKDMDIMNAIIGSVFVVIAVTIVFVVFF